MDGKGRPRHGAGGVWVPEEGVHDEVAGTEGEEQVRVLGWQGGGAWEKYVTRGFLKFVRQ